MEDQVIAGAIVTIVTGLVRKVRQMGEAGIVLTLGVVASIIGVLWWGSQNWEVMEIAYTAVKTVVISIASAIGIYEANKQKGKSDDTQDNGADPGRPSPGSGGSGDRSSASGDSGRIDVPQLLDRGSSG